MKDLEKIKSEDLACQVADANPANFAIEQEVAQLVGATVPQPTQPSADDARELGAQLLVFLRRALLPIRSALRTAVAAIYAHLDSRCTDYTPAAYAPYIPRPYDPMGIPPTPRSVANLLTALTAFSARKISNGSAPSDGIPDGTSLAHLLVGSNSVTKIIDDNHGWIANKAGALANICNLFPSLEEIVLNCSSVTATLDGGYGSRALKVTLTECATIPASIAIGTYSSGYPNYEVHIYGLKTTNISDNGAASLYVGKYYLHDYERGVFRVAGSGSWQNTATSYIYIGCKGKPTDVIRLWCYFDNATNLTDVEIRQGARQPITLDNMGNLTAENIVNHIFEKLADNSDGDPITINIGSANLAKLTDEQKAIAQNKNYTLA